MFFSRKQSRSTLLTQGLSDPMPSVSSSRFPVPSLSRLIPLALLTGWLTLALTPEASAQAGYGNMSNPAPFGNPYMNSAPYAGATGYTPNRWGGINYTGTPTPQQSAPYQSSNNRRNRGNFYAHGLPPYNNNNYMDQVSQQYGQAPYGQPYGNNGGYSGNGYPGPSNVGQPNYAGAYGNRYGSNQQVPTASVYRQPSPAYQMQRPPQYQQQQPQPVAEQNGGDDGGNFDDYARFSDEGTRLFNGGQMTQAIAAFEKALQVAPTGSLPVIYNNLAVVHIKRGNYFHGLKQESSALTDFRKAFYYIDAAWPEGYERKTLHAQNQKVARENLNIVYKNLGMNPSDRSKHLQQARQLRLAGKFPESIAEYTLALESDPHNPQAVRALGDLYTVMNLPEKSKKYYALAANSNSPSVAMPVGASVPVTAASGGKDDTFVQLGNAQMKTGETDKAISSFNQALAINPGNQGALNMLEKIWRDELNFNPQSVTAHANLGSIFQKKRQFDKALQQYNAAEHFADNDPKTAFEVKKQIRLNMGTLFQAQKRYDLALKAYDTVLQADPKNQTALRYKAGLLEESGNVPGAIDAYEKMLSANPGDQAVQNILLSLITKQSDPQKVASGLADFADRFKSNASIQARIAENFHQRKDFNNALTYYQRAIQADPNMAGVWANMGSIYQAQGKDSDSLQAFQKAQALDPKNATYKQLADNANTDRAQNLYEQAVKYQQQNKLTEALDTYKQALAIEDNPDIRYNYAIALQTNGQLDDAVAEYKKSLAKQPQNAEVAYALGTVYQQKKDNVNAEAAYKNALKLKPGYEDAKKALTEIQGSEASASLDAAIAAYEGKNYTLATTKVDQAISRNAQDATAHYYKGLILDAQKKLLPAIQSYKTAIRLNPSFPDAYYALGVALDTNKDPAGAKLVFQKFIQVSSPSGAAEDDFVKYARERVK